MMLYYSVLPISLLFYIILSEFSVEGKSNSRNLNGNDSTTFKRYPSSNTFVPLITTLKPRSISNINNSKSLRDAEVKSTSRSSSTKRQSTNKETNLNNFDNHESFSPSTLTSFYRFMNQKPERNRNSLGLKQDDIDHIRLPSQELYNQQLITQRDALVMDQPSIGDAELNTPLIFATGTNLHVSNQLDNPQILGQQHADSTSNNGQTHTQLENNFYVSGIENQQMVPQELRSQDLALGIHSDQLQSDIKDSFIPILQNQLPFSSSAQNYYTPEHGFSVPFKANHQTYPKTQHQLSKQSGVLFHSDNSNSKSDQKQKKEMLTNAQLVALIDELKDFNNIYANKHGSSTRPSEFQLKDSSWENVNDTEKLFTEVVNSLDKSQPHAEEDVQTKASESNDQDSDEENQKEDDQKTTDDFDSEDLAKFAKYLLAREGAKAKSSREPKKNRHPDEQDEDEDMKDALLESSRRQTKPELKKNKSLLANLKERKQTEIDTRIDRFIKEISEKAKKLDQPKYQQKSGSRRNEELDDFSDRARKRRDYNYVSYKDPRNLVRNEFYPAIAIEGTKDNMTMHNVIGSNIPKSYSMKSEVINNNEALKSPMKFGKEKSFNKSVALQRPQPHLSVPVPRRSDENIDTTLREMKDQNKDHKSLVQGLQKVQEAKAQVRSRITFPVNNLVKEALKEEVNKLVQQNPELPLQTSGDGSVLKYDGGKNSDSEAAQEINEEGSTYSELIPAQVEPERGTKDAHVHTDQSLQDGYPISEKVADRLNKLSRNLDKYFNDGFLQDVEIKSQGKSREKKDVEESQPDEKNIESRHPREPTTYVNENKLPAKDSDFDIDVSIDGKRDTQELDDKERSETDQRSINKIKGKVKRVRKASESKGDSEFERSGRMKKGSRLEASKLRRLALDNSKLRRRHKSTDPVENESLDTPIGPDEDEIPPQKGSAIGTKGSKESQINYGRKSHSKFYQEPD